MLIIIFQNSYNLNIKCSQLKLFSQKSSHFSSILEAGYLTSTEPIERNAEV